LSANAQYLTESKPQPFGKSFVILTKYCMNLCIDFATLLQFKTRFKEMTTTKHIRNFCIIAHIDHGKSTLADRLLEKTLTIGTNKKVDQILDDMDLERERGITIKAHAIKMLYKQGAQQYILNMIDTPGHVDFTYEVSRSLAACEGALLIVDATQGIEAQTLSNLYLALEHDLTIIPIINKIDLPGADPDSVAETVGDLLGYDPDEILRISAKAGIGIEAVLEKIVKEIPAPPENSSKPLQALVFDSVYDSYRGVIVYVRVFSGCLKANTRIRMMKTKADYQCTEVGTFSLVRDSTKELECGQVGYLLANIKTIGDVKVGDTITLADAPCPVALPGYQEIRPMIFSGLYPIDPEAYKELRDALEKLQLNDAALSWEPETSEALGFGFRAGFLGLLHMEIVQERLDREFNVDIITTMPNVEYHVYLTNGSMVKVENPSKLPDPGKYNYIEEPYINAQIFVPKEFVGAVMQLAEEKRGNFKTMEYVDEHKVNLKYELPLAEIMLDFYDKLKSYSKGYAGLDYEPCGYRKTQLVKLDILLNGEPVDAFSVIIHKDKAFHYGQEMATKLKELIPRQQYDVAVQAAIGTRVISRTTIKALRKNVTAKCYGGDITRKRKLLEKQKEGKKRMKSVGSVEVPQSAFLAVLKVDSGKSGAS
jgi:GTP-binding protein LepA